jgi:hypothetical protein
MERKEQRAKRQADAEAAAAEAAALDIKLHGNHSYW